MAYFVENLDKLTALVLLLSASLYVRILLQLARQTWALTVPHTATIMILPILTYVITSVISGNIALSLGLVGALSIVRFRNPVRSPLELSVYFGSITLGIAASVSLIWCIFLILSITCVVIFLVFLNSAYKIFMKKEFFFLSFSEGNNLSTLQICSSESIDVLDNHPNLISKISEGDVLNYSIASNNFYDLRNLEKNLVKHDCIHKTSLIK